jgi:hypothetical protein
MTLKFRFFTLITIQFLIQFSGSLNAYEKSFNLKDKTVTVSISAEDFAHIREGQETDNKHYGLHDMGVYLEKYPLNGEEFFDKNMNAFIIPSKKGMGLLNIIEELSQRRKVNYHTLFPAGVLSEEFIFNAFRRAYIADQIGLQVKHKNTNIDYNFGKNRKKGNYPTIRHKSNKQSALFFVEYNGFQVAGIFEEIDGVHHIKTCFPDLSWYYRIDFTHRKDEVFSSHRFFAYSREEGYWVQHGAPSRPFAPKEDVHWPRPYTALSRSMTGSSKGQQMTPDLFLKFEQVSRHLHATHLLQEEASTYHVFDFFFDDPTTPTKEELLNLGLFMKRIIAGTKLTVAKIKVLPTITDQLMKFLNAETGLNFRYHEVNADNGALTSIVDLCLAANVETGEIQFAETLIHQLLTYHIGSHFKPHDFTTDDWIYTLAAKFHKNLQKKLLNDDADMIATMDNNGLVFDLRRDNTQTFTYSLALTSTQDITVQSFYGQKQNYRMALAIKGSVNDPFSFQLFSIIKAYLNEIDDIEASRVQS